MIRLYTCVLFCLLALSTTAWGQTYTWNVASGDWGTAGSWNPSRDTPTSSDILVFNGAVQATPTVTNIPNQTIGQLQIINNCYVTFSSAVATAGTGTLSKAATNITGVGTAFSTEIAVGDVLFAGTAYVQWEITAVTTNTAATAVQSGTVASTPFSIAPKLKISGGTGDDFVIEAGSTLYLNLVSTASPLSIFLLTGTTGKISGTYISQGCQSKINVVDASGLSFENGSICRQNETGPGSLFLGTGNANAVIFKSGSTFDQVATSSSNGPSNPFGLSQPSSRVIFQTGSLFKYRIPGGTPAASGRTYPNLEYDPGSGTCNPTGGSAFSVNNLTIKSGTMTIGVTSTPGHAIKGNISVLSGATLVFGPSSASTINLNGTTAQTITNAGTLTLNTANQTLIVNNSNGITLGSPVTMSAGTLTLTAGNIATTNTNLLTLGSAATLSGGSAASFVNGPMAHTIASTSLTTKTFPIGKGTAYRPVTLAVTQGAATLTTYTAEVFNAAPVTNTIPGTLGPTLSTVRYWSIVGNPTTAITSSTVQIAYDTDDGVTDNANLRIAQGPSSGGGAWVNLLGTGTANTTGTITSTAALTDFSTNTVYTLAQNTIGTNLLPVEMTSFTGSLQSANCAMLKWSTATEVNNMGFDVERKSAKSDWAKIGFVAGNGTSNAPHSYTYADNAAAGTYSYRLKQIDRDGKFEYSQVVEVKIALTAADYTLQQNYPNPFNPATVVRFAVPTAQKATLKIYNSAGQEVATLFNGIADAGRMYELSFDGSQLASGVYFSILQTGGKQDVKKMTLLR